MSNELNKKQDNSTKQSNDDQANICPECQKNPCICQKTPDHKTWVKGSHRKGSPPKLKWI